MLEQSQRPDGSLLKDATLNIAAGVAFGVLIGPIIGLAVGYELGRHAILPLINQMVTS